jgi:hypothetical protein
MNRAVVIPSPAAVHISSDIDAIALLGVVCKGIQKLKEVGLTATDKIRCVHCSVLMHMSSLLSYSISRPWT